jgi:hypothetical protein
MPELRLQGVYVAARIVDRARSRKGGLVEGSLAGFRDDASAGDALSRYSPRQPPVEIGLLAG